MAIPKPPKVKYQTVGTLMNALGRYPRDLPVYLAGDEEGNTFGRLLDVEADRCEDTDGFVEMVGEKGDVANCVVLWPA